MKSSTLKLLTLSVLAFSIGPVLADVSDIDKKAAAKPVPADVSDIDKKATAKPVPADVSDIDKKAAAKLATETCANCHGAGGRSTAVTFPRLAGQTPAYIEAQLKAFRDQTRADPDAIAYMWGMASQLSDSMIAALAEYYSQQKPATGTPGKSPTIAAGREIFEKGVPATQIPACETCHGKGAVGMGAFPRLAGQHAPYLFKQMLVIQNALRLAPVMHGIVKDLTPAQMQSVAAYLESQ